MVLVASISAILVELVAFWVSPSHKRVVCSVTYVIGFIICSFIAYGSRTSVANSGFNVFLWCALSAAIGGLLVLIYIQINSNKNI